MHGITQSFLDSVKAKEWLSTELIQELWSGYGQILRCKLSGFEITSVIVKDIRLSNPQEHPRGWSTDLSHQRKLRSYQVEVEWYQKWAMQCNKDCRVPRLYYSELAEDRILLVLEDLDHSGFSARVNEPNMLEVKLGLEWLANFHAKFLGKSADGLWQQGTYWHLATRPDEWEAMEEGNLKKHAKKIDQKLSNAKFQTIVHGDAKLANFCYSDERKQIAAVDFQYVGGGCGMKDVAYFLSSCPQSTKWQENEAELLNYYFNALRNALSMEGKEFEALEGEWRELYVFAWADFIRFLKGWMPDHWKIDQHSLNRAERAILQIS